MPFGYLLKRLREEKGLSLRELGRMSGVDHAYIYRLEKGEHESPSREVAAKLAGGLGLVGREAWLLGYVASFREYIDVAMVAYALRHSDVTELEFSWAVAVKFRWPKKLACPILFGCARQIVRVVDGFLTHSRSPILRSSKAASSRAKIIH